MVIEVLSKSTREYDRKTKVIRYREIPSLRHIVLVSQYAVAVEHSARSSSGKWKTEHLDDRNATLDLSAVGASLPLAGIYEAMFVD